MTDFEKQYHEKLRTPQEIADEFQSGFVCATGSCLSEPTAITQALGDALRKDDRGDIIHNQTMSVHPSPFFDPELKDKYSSVSWFSTAYGRKAFYEGAADIMPGYYRDFPDIYEKYLNLDVFYATVSPMDEHGYFSFGLTCSENQTLACKARHIFLEVNKYMPRTFGEQQIHISQVDLLCENHKPLSTASPAKMDETSRTIGALIAEEIPDRATIQLGIGSIPEAVGLALKDKKNLGIHTELFSDSMLDLIECGAVTNHHKTLHPGKSITTFAYGSQRVYDYVNNNVGIEFRPVNYVNDPNVIAQNDLFMSVNSCIEVDFWGQVASESIGSRHFSGTGGQSDFVRGARQSRGGKSFIAIPSTAKGGEVSRITPTLTNGALVSTSKNDVDYIVTEYGIARLRGCTVKNRVRQLIAIAHPRFREELQFTAKQMMLL
ncbi:MAG: 4-hydroxybutyrate--acetyl-CoA CoA transferase [Clostridiales bacterium]|nr:4-hydroxybutyrate--acetyl-CoA CoA transferase [Clostridiales bacterium]